MNVFSHMIHLWKSNTGKRDATLHRRLVLFFLCAMVSVILILVLLLFLLGITGDGKDAVLNYTEGELDHFSEAIHTDFAELSVTGIAFSELLSSECEGFFRDNGIEASELQNHPSCIENLLTELTDNVLSVAQNNTCGGAFLLLDATVRTDKKVTAKSGIFIKKTQPVSSKTIVPKNYFLRGPANAARAHSIDLMGQWKMEYDISGQEFFLDVMETARAHPNLPLSRLYYWSGRITLKENSEAGFLLCVPLRVEDGTVFGLCGIEVSDRMFKTLYSPSDTAYDDIFGVCAPIRDKVLHSEKGMIAGNNYLTGFRMTEGLFSSEREDEFDRFINADYSFAGKIKPLQLYPDSSPYAKETWTTAILMPEVSLNTAIQGNLLYYSIITICVLALSVAISIFIAQKYLNPVEKALQRIRNKAYEEALDDSGYAEFTDLIQFLSEEKHLTDSEIKRLNEEQKNTKMSFQNLVERKSDEVDRERYQFFQKEIKSLTKTEKSIFNLYVSGKKGVDIMKELNIAESTLKYHNNHIYSKLGVSGVKELRLFLTLMREEQGK